jgi:hypothetical protein
MVLGQVGRGGAMALERLPLLRLGGEEAFAAYEAAFDALFRARPDVDVLGRTVKFPFDACRHACTTDLAGEGYRRGVRAWVQARAERIGWIHRALTAPDEVRPDFQDPDRIVYLLVVPASPEEDLPQGYFVVGWRRRDTTRSSS